MVFEVTLMDVWKTWGNSDTDSFLREGNLKQVPNHGRSASLQTERSRCRSSNVFAETEVHSASVRPISDESVGQQELEMKAFSGGGYLAAELPCKSRCLRPSRFP